LNPRFRFLITILVGTKIKFKVAENMQLTGKLSMMMMLMINILCCAPTDTPDKLSSVLDSLAFLTFKEECK
jgi:hypothetical protein